MDITNCLDKAFEVFLRYGFRKTTMDDIAREVGISRQALYKSHGNKEIIFRAVVEHLCAGVIAEVTAVFERHEGDLKQRLATAFDAFGGRMVDELMRSPHAHEIIDAARVESGAIKERCEAEFRELVAQQLQSKENRLGPVSAREAALVLFMASKGLALTVASREEYRVGIELAINAVVNEGA